MNLTTYIENYLNEEKPQFSWDITYNEVKRIYELSLGLLENEDKRYPRLEDIQGNVSNGSHVYLVDRICFYDVKISYFEPSHYLKTVKVNFEEGIEKGYVDLLLDEFVRIGTQGKTQLYEFLREQQDPSFKLEWNEKRFNVALKTAEDVKRYDKEVLACEEVREKN